MKTNSTSSVPNQVWYCPPGTDGCSYFPFYHGHESTAGTGFSVSWPGTTDMALWPTVAQGVAWIDSTQIYYTEPLVFRANMQYDVVLTIVSYQRSKINWLFLNSRSYFQSYLHLSALINEWRRNYQCCRGDGLQRIVHVHTFPDGGGSAGPELPVDLRTHGEHSLERWWYIRVHRWCICVYFRANGAWYYHW